MSKALRGEVWDVEFRPAVGAEIQKTRPAVKPAFAQFSWFVFLPPTPGNGLMKESGADAFQVKSVSEHRLVRKLGQITAEQVEQIAAAIALCIGY
jgi:mRNA interferase MazF